MAEENGMEIILAAPSPATITKGPFYSNNTTRLSKFLSPGVIKGPKVDVLQSKKISTGNNMAMY